MFNEISKKLFGPHGYQGENWTMTVAERFALAGILSHREPRISIEIGTLNGGSLSIISKYSEKVYSIDPNPEVKDNLRKKFENVEFITGFSQKVLPNLINELNKKEEAVGFVLVDGDHTEEGVRKDIEEVLNYIPMGPLWILMHDSFNPDCRQGIKAVDWESNRYVQWIDFDFIPGFLSSIPGWEDQMWCGFALAYMEEKGREGELKYDELLGRQFDQVFPISSHAK
ncbi:MAG: hypothetical protein GVY36_06610 [Verrucomicrobia bacterium]|jgi:hypothetical protein|nr:hypothetical protein [Verrucomicrobiota bacterium]